MTDQPPTLDPDDRILVAALAAGATQDEAGALIGRSGRTVRRRLADDPDLRAAVQAERDAHACRIADLLVAQAAQAVASLSRIITDGADRDVVGACRVMLSEARQHREAAYVADRLAHVETLLLAHQAAG